MGPCGNGPGSQLTLTRVLSIGTARTIAGGEAGIPDGKVLITRLGADTIGSAWWASKRVTRNWKRTNSKK